MSAREPEIRQIIDILMRRRQNNPILTGDAGVGKTAIVEGFAQRVVEGSVPPSLAGIAVRTLDLGLLQAGAGMRGEFEQRLRSVIEEVTGSPKPIVLFIDEAHTLIGAGGQPGQSDAANLLKPALARGDVAHDRGDHMGRIQTVFEKDPALARRFQVVKVAEPTEMATVEILRGLAPKLEAHHGIRILETAMTEAARLSHRYIPGRQLPDKAISVLDTSCARVAIAQSTRSASAGGGRPALRGAGIRARAVARRRPASAAVMRTEWRSSLTRKRPPRRSAIAWRTDGRSSGRQSDRIRALERRMLAGEAETLAPNGTVCGSSWKKFSRTRRWSRSPSTADQSPRWYPVGPAFR